MVSLLREPKDGIELTMRVSSEEYTKLTMTASQHRLDVGEFLRRRGLGLRTPKPMGDILAQIAESSKRIEGQLVTLTSAVTCFSPHNTSSLDRSLRQLRDLLTKVRRQELSQERNQSLREEQDRLQEDSTV